MDKRLNELLRRCHERFGQGHDVQRERLLADLRTGTSVEPVVSSHREAMYEGRYRRLVGRAVAVAAVLMVCLGVFLYENQGDGAERVLSAQVAYAEAMDNVGNIDSVHFRMATPNRKGESFAVEGWWRRPHDFRIVFDDGLIMTGNGEVRCRRNDDKLTIENAGGPSLEMMILGELGPFFAVQQSLTGQWVSESKLESSKKVEYKGEACLSLAVLYDGKRFEYIVNERASQAAAPLIYEVKVYRGEQPGRLLERVEVLGIDREMPETLFRLEPDEKVEVIDRRSPR